MFESPVDLLKFAPLLTSSVYGTAIVKSHRRIRVLLLKRDILP